MTAIKLRSSPLRLTMSRKELVLLVSRTFALLLITWAFAEITVLPDHLFSFFHALSKRSVLATSDYSSRYYLILTAGNVLRMIAFLFAAALFWRCGPRVEALFSRSERDSSV
jgi:hypothetical protein